MPSTAPPFRGIGAHFAPMGETLEKPWDPVTFCGSWAGKRGAHCGPMGETLEQPVVSESHGGNLAETFELSILPMAAAPYSGRILGGFRGRGFGCMLRDSKIPRRFAPF